MLNLRAVNVTIILLIFYKFIEGNLNIDDITNLATSVRRHYSSPSIFILYDVEYMDLGLEKILVEAIRSYSKQDSMSQAIPFNDLQFDHESRRRNALYAFTIDDRSTFDNAIVSMKNSEISYHPWLFIFMKNVSGFHCDKPSINDFLRLRMDTEMIVKCNGDKILKRYYRIFDDVIEVVDFAEWTVEKILRFTSPKRLAEVKRDLKGISLNIAKESEANDRVKIHLANYKWSLLTELAITGNFKVNVTFEKDIPGYYDKKTKKWIGLMNDMVERKADICIFLFSMAMERMQVVDFITPILSSQCYLYARLPDGKRISWMAYFKAFDKNSWTAIVGSLVSSSLLLYFMKRKCQSMNFSFIDSFINIWGVYNQQGSSDNASILSIRILYLVTLGCSLILNTIYSAAIASYITTLEIRLPFSSYDEFKIDNTYQFAVLTGTNDISLIDGNDTLLTPLKHRLKDDCDLPVDLSEAFQQICDERTAFYTDTVSYKSMTTIKNCKIDSVKMDRIEYLSFILPKNSQYTASISHLVLSLREYGILKKLENQYFYNYTEIIEVQPDAVTFIEVLPIFAIMIAGFIAASFVYFMEIINYRIFECHNVKMEIQRNFTFKKRTRVHFQRHVLLYDDALK